MRIFGLGLVFGFVGLACTTGRPLSAPAPTLVRASLIDASAAILEKQLRSENWEFQIDAVAKSGQAALNPGENWDENTTTVTFRARRSGGDWVLIRPEESMLVLRGIRSDLRKVIQSWGGEPLDTSEGEAYRERWLIVPYRLDRILGTIRVRLLPDSDRAEETVNQLLVVIREQHES